MALNIPTTATAALLLLCCLLPSSSASLDSTGCPEAFLSRCTCGMGRYPKSPNLPSAPMRFIVNCTNTGFKDATMLQELPEMSEILIFTGNKLGELPLNVFGNTKDYDELEVIDLSNNGITFIPGRTFHKVYNVRTLILNHNDIEISARERPRMFYNFESLENLHLTNAFTEAVNSSYYLLSLEDIFYESDLRLLLKLHLEQNEIYTIGKNTSIFCQLPSLEQLYLGDNRLFDLDFRIDCMPDINYIDLQHNSINQLSVEAMERIDQFSKSKRLTVELQQNPFMCDCYSQSFITWLKKTNVTLRDAPEYRCADGIPRSTVGKSLLNIDENKLKCPLEIEQNGGRPVRGGPPNVHIHGYSASTIGTLSFLLAFVSAILLAVAYYHRTKLEKKAKPYWEHITRKVGYSGLANEEVAKVVAV